MKIPTCFPSKLDISHLKKHPPYQLLPTIKASTCRLSKQDQIKSLAPKPSYSAAFQNYSTNLGPTKVNCKSTHPTSTLPENTQAGLLIKNFVIKKKHASEINSNPKIKSIDDDKIPDSYIKCNTYLAAITLSTTITTNPFASHYLLWSLRDKTTTHLVCITELSFGISLMRRALVHLGLLWAVDTKHLIYGFEWVVSTEERGVFPKWS